MTSGQNRSVYFTNEEWKQIDALVKSTGKGPSQLVREATMCAIRGDEHLFQRAVKLAKERHSLLVVASGSLLIALVTACTLGISTYL